MIEASVINEYLDWLRDKKNYPPTGSPEEWVEEMLMSEARDRLGLIKDLFESDTTKPTLDIIKHLVYADCKEIMEGN